MTSEEAPGGGRERRVRVVVTGRVQGVFFRATVRDAARSRAVGGWVRNRPDGDVEAEFQGEPRAVEQLIEVCRAGPPGARVDEVTVAEIAPQPGVQGFRVT